MEEIAYLTLQADNGKYYITNVPHKKIKTEDGTEYRRSSKVEKQLVLLYQCVSENNIRTINFSHYSSIL